MAMYDLRDFCNIISNLRRKKGLSQSALAEMLRISPQAISKWECGVGLPDVTLFPAIADALGVPIGVLFGEKNETEEKIMSKTIDKTMYEEEFEPCMFTSAAVGNVCRISFIDGVRERALIRAVGDPTFIKYFSAEEESGKLLIEVKNPSGSADKWTPYDREDFDGENIVEVFTGRERTNITVDNYLDLQCTGCGEGDKYEVVITPMTDGAPDTHTIIRLCP